MKLTLTLFTCFSLLLLQPFSLHSQCVAVDELNINSITTIAECDDDNIATFEVSVNVVIGTIGSASACFEYFNSTISTTEPQRICWEEGTELIDFIFSFTADCNSSINLSGYATAGGLGMPCNPLSGAAQSVVLEAPVPVPVELSSLTGRLVDNNKISLDWSTATEENSAFFQVEKFNSSSSTWYTIGIVEAAGNSAEVIEYNYVDRIVEVNNTYRLKIVDLDETYEYSPLITITRELDANNNFGVLISPNPNQGEFSVSIKAINEIQEGHLKIYDLTGKVLHSEEIYLAEGVSDTRFIDLRAYPAGTYYYHLTVGYGIKTGKILILKD